MTSPLQGTGVSTLDLPGWEMRQNCSVRGAGLPQRALGAAPLLQGVAGGGACVDFVADRSWADASRAGAAAHVPSGHLTPPSRACPRTRPTRCSHEEGGAGGQLQVSASSPRGQQAAHRGPH